MTRKKILIVDDEVLIALDMAQIVSDAGHDVAGPAFCLDSAQALARTESLDLALLDINIGGELVWPLARTLKQANVPTVFISANSAHPEFDQEFAGTTCLDKPISRSALLNLL